MRVAYLINLYPKISHSFIRREIHALEAQGHEVMRIALRGWDDVLVDPEDQRERQNTHYVLRNGPLPLLAAAALMCVLRPRLFAKSLHLAWQMSRGAERPLLIHLVYLAEASRIALWLRNSGIQHLHAHFGTNPAEVAMLVHALGGPPWSFTAHGIETFDRRPFIGLTEKLRRCAFAVAVCSYGRSQLYRSIEYHHWHKIRIIHCGLDPGFHSAHPIPAPSSRRLVCIGRLCEEKGQLLLVEAASRLAAEGLDFEIVLAGDGELRTEIEALIARHKLQDSVRITGWISSDQVRDELLASRAMVLPSFAEGLPVVIMESMALERPVISTFVGGIPELVHSDEHGWLVPAGDVDALTNAIRTCLTASSPSLVRMGQAARKRVLIRHDVNQEAAKLARLFENDAQPPANMHRHVP